MTKKIRKVQIDGLAEEIQDLQNKRVVSVAVTGTTNKSLTLTFSDGTTLVSNFTDIDTTYPAITAALLNGGVDTAQRTIAVNILVDYINARLSAVLKWKGTRTDFSQLPTTGNQVGDVWNITNPFTYKGENYPGGSNVAWSDAGEWDVLAGFIDTSQFITVEVDPKGVQAVSVTGTTNKTLNITLRDGTVISGSFTDIDTTYAQGTLTDLNNGSSTSPMVWGAKTISDFVLSLGVDVFQEVFVVSSGQISGGFVNLPLAQTSALANKMMVYLNGVKQPLGAQSISGTNLRLTQSALPTPVIASDEIEVFYLK